MKKMKLTFALLMSLTFSQVSLAFPEIRAAHSSHSDRSKPDEDMQICQDMQECRSLQVRLQERIKELKGEVLSIVLGNFLGENISNYKAEKLCEEEGLRLPNVRELAEMASRVCTKDIIGKEPCGAQMKEIEKGSGGYCRGDFRKISVRDRVTPWGHADDSFCYSNKGYKRPLGNLGKYMIWSSQVHPENRYSDGSLYTDSAYLFMSGSGRFTIPAANSDHKLNSARCVVSESYN